MCIQNTTKIRFQFKQNITTQILINCVFIFSLVLSAFFFSLFCFLFPVLDKAKRKITTKKISHLHQMFKLLSKNISNYVYLIYVYAYIFIYIYIYFFIFIFFVWIVVWFCSCKIDISFIFIAFHRCHNYFNSEICFSIMKMYGVDAKCQAKRHFDRIKFLKNVIRFLFFFSLNLIFSLYCSKSIL